MCIQICLYVSMLSHTHTCVHPKAPARPGTCHRQDRFRGEQCPARGDTDLGGTWQAGHLQGTGTATDTHTDMDTDTDTGGDQARGPRESHRAGLEPSTGLGMPQTAPGGKSPCTKWTSEPPVQNEKLNLIKKGKNREGYVGIGVCCFFSGLGRIYWQALPDCV